MKADVVVPAASGGQLTSENIHRVQARMIVEGANSPMTVDGEKRYDGIIIPDVLANSGGVKVSFDEMQFNRRQTSRTRATKPSTPD